MQGREESCDSSSVEADAPPFPVIPSSWSPESRIEAEVDESDAEVVFSVISLSSCQPSRSCINSKVFADRGMLIDLGALREISLVLGDILASASASRSEFPPPPTTFFFGGVCNMSKHSGSSIISRRSCI